MVGVKEVECWNYFAFFIEKQVKRFRGWKILRWNKNVAPTQLPPNITSKGSGGYTLYAVLGNSLEKRPQTFLERSVVAVLHRQRQRWMKPQ